MQKQKNSVYRIQEEIFSKNKNININYKQKSRTASILSI